MEISEIRALGLEKLTGLAQSLGVNGGGDLSTQELELAVMRALAERQELTVEGVLEIMPDGYGFLRERSCLPGRYDVYVSPSQIKRFGLKDGDIVRGPVRQPREGERYFALLRVDKVTGLDPDQVRKRVDFQQLTPLHPDEQLVLEHDPDEPSTRMIDLFAPIGKGQRGLIVSPQGREDDAPQAHRPRDRGQLPRRQAHHPPCGRTAGGGDGLPPLGEAGRGHRRHVRHGAPAPHPDRGTGDG